MPLTTKNGKLYLNGVEQSTIPSWSKTNDLGMSWQNYRGVIDTYRQGMGLTPWAGDDPAEIPPSVNAPVNAPVNTPAYEGTAPSTYWSGNMPTYTDAGSPTMASPTIPQSVFDAAALGPYTRGLVEAGLKMGQQYSLLTPEAYSAELARRGETLRETVEPVTSALISQGQQEVRLSMERGGKLSSSAAARAQMGVAGLYSAQAASAISQGVLNIYGQLDTAREAEMNRMFQSGQTMYTGEQALGLAQYQGEVSLAGTRYTADVSRQIAQIQTTADERIARIQADTTLTGYDKQIQIAQINREAQTDVADIYTTSQERMQGADFAFRTDETGVRDWVRNVKLGEKTAEEQIATIREQMQLDWKTTVYTTDIQKDQFEKNLKYIYEELGIKRDFNEWSKDVAYAQLSESVRQANMDGEFRWAQLDLACKQWDINRADQLGLARETLQIQRDVATSDIERGRIDTLLAILDNPSVAALLSNTGQLGGDAYGELVGRVLQLSTDLSPEEIGNALSAQASMDLTLGGKTFTISGARSTQAPTGGTVFQLRDTAGNWHNVSNEIYLDYKKRGNL